MATLGLSILGSMLGGPVGALAGTVAGSLVDNELFPGKPPTAAARVTTSTYGNPIPIVRGPSNRVGGNMIWSSLIKKDTHKHLFGLAGTTYTFHVDAAFAVCRAPDDGSGINPHWLQKIWANGVNVFDAAGAIGGLPTPDANGVVTWDLGKRAFTNINVFRTYCGTKTQLPDPGIEAAVGVGQVPAYRQTVYVLISGIQLSNFGGSIPNFEFEVIADERVTIAEIVTSIATKSGVDPNRMSTSSLTNNVAGFSIVSQTDGFSALQPLALAYDFDFAEVGGTLRCVPRGQPPICALSTDQFAGHVYGAAQPDAFTWPRQDEMKLPHMASLTFPDISRDYADNTQSAQRTGGSAQSNISTSVPITLTSDQGRQICDRLLWEAWTARQTLSAQTDDRLTFLEAARTYSINTPAGFEEIRITKRNRGANGVIDFEAKRDFQSLYFSAAPGAGSPTPGNEPTIGGPVNPPYFIEAPSTFPGLNGEPTLFIFISGGEAGIFNPEWNGCEVWVSLDGTNYLSAGICTGPSIMGVSTFELEAYGGSNPDITHATNVSTEMSGQDPFPVDDNPAKEGQAPSYFGSPAEWLGVVDVTDDGGNNFHLTRFYRGLYGTKGADHLSGVEYAQVSSNTFRFPMRSQYIGQTLYFRFVGGGETIDTVATYTYNPNGTSFGTGPGGLPSAPSTPPAVTPGAGQNIIDIPATTPEDNVTGFDIRRANGASAGISDSSIIATIAASSTGTTFTDTTALPGKTYTYFVVPINQIGPGDGSTGVTVTTTDNGPPGPAGAVYSKQDISTAPLSKVIGRYPSPYAWTLPATTSVPAGFVEGKVDTAPASDTIFTLLKDGSSVATVKWASGSTTPTLICASDVTFALGDYLDLETPSNLNGMTGAFGLSVVGQKT